MTPTKALLLAREPDESAGQPTPALVSVANRPLICHALDWLAAGGIRDVAIVSSARIADAAWDAVEDGSEWGLNTQWLLHAPGETFGDSLASLSEFAPGSAVPFTRRTA